MGPRVAKELLDLAIMNAAAWGVMPPVPPHFYERPTHRAYWKRMRAIEDAAKVGDLEKVKTFAADPFWQKASSSRKIVRRYMKNVISALTFRERRHEAR